jgi:hypothetical protein
MAIPECVPIKEVEMRKHVLLLTTAAAILGYGAIAASAQAPGAQTPSTQQSPTPQVTPSGSMQQQDQTQLQRRAQIEQDGDQFRYHRGMMGGGMMGGGMMGHGMMGQGYGRGSPVAMRIIFSLMDANGDGKLSLEEFQAAHERIFKAMDADHDGTVTFEEMQAFIRGH